MPNMTISSSGITFIKTNEGLRLKVYKDQNGNSTVGYGHMSHALKVGEEITQLDADNFLSSDLVSAQNTINSTVKVPLNQSQFDALGDFVFNIGPGRFKTSTLLKLLNQSQYHSAAEQFLVWDKPLGILGRRIREQHLFLT